MPSPLDRPPSAAHSLDGDEIAVEMDAKGPLAALAFKVQFFEGRRHVFARIYRGAVEPGDEVALAGRDLTERVARVFSVDAHRRSRLDHAEAGQIVLFGGLRHATTGDTLTAPDTPLLLERIDAREPVLGLAVEPVSSQEEDKFLEVLSKVTEEDPTLRLEEDDETGQRVLKGMGELHLMIVFERLEREFGLVVKSGRPRVVHRETVTRAAKATGTVDRVMKVGDETVELKAEAAVSVVPRERGSGVEVAIEPVWEPEGATPNEEQREAVRSGTHDALAGGPVEGAPLEDLAVHVDRVRLFGAASSPQALRAAIGLAVRDALIAGAGVVLQPIMAVEVVVPDQNMGTVLGDLQARGATIQGQRSEDGAATLFAECALSALIGYATDLRSETKGHGHFSMEFVRFDAR